MILQIGIPVIIVVSVLFSGLMAKKKGNIGTGKVYGALMLVVLVLALLVLVYVVDQQ